MAYFFYLLFLILHVVTAAAWFGLGLRIPGQARRALAAEPAAAAPLLDEGGRTVFLMDIMIVLTVLFSYGNFFLAGGFAELPPWFHIAFTLILVLAAVHFLLIRSGWHGLQQALERNAPAEADSGRKKVVIGAGIGHTLWLIILVLMFWTRVLGLF